MISWNPDAVQRFLGVAPVVRHGDFDVEAVFTVPLASGEAVLSVNVAGGQAFLRILPSSDLPEIDSSIQCDKIGVHDDPEQGELLVLSGPVGHVAISRDAQGLSPFFSMYIQEDLKKVSERNVLRDALLFGAGAVFVLILLLLFGVFG